MNDFHQGLLIIISVIIVYAIWKRLAKNRKIRTINNSKRVTARYDIVGMKYRKSKHINEGAFDGFAFADTNNKYDKNAVAILNRKNKIVGYVPKSDNEHLSEKLRRYPNNKEKIRGYLTFNSDTDKWYGSFDIYI